MKLPSVYDIKSELHCIILMIELCAILVDPEEGHNAGRNLVKIKWGIPLESYTYVRFVNLLSNSLM